VTYAGDVYGYRAARKAFAVLGVGGGGGRGGGRGGGGGGVKSDTSSRASSTVVMAAMRWHGLTMASLARQPSACLRQEWSPAKIGPSMHRRRLNSCDHPDRLVASVAYRRLDCTVYMKTDWGISLVSSDPMAMVAIPSLRIQRIALFSMLLYGSS